MITGASSGIGMAAARFLLKSECRVIATARRLDRLQALRDEVPTDVHPLELDVRDLAGIQAAIECLPSRFAQIDIVLNNAGLALGIDPRSSPAAPG